MPSATKDPHSVSNTNAFVCTHLKWVASVHFDAKVIKATAEYNVVVVGQDTSMLLDCSHINVEECLVNEQKVDFKTSNAKFGGMLDIKIPKLAGKEFKLVIKYESTEKCSAAQWLNAEQTLGGKYPFLFTQCQAIHARSLVPCQDTPSVKFTYEALVTVDQPLTALMSAQRCGSDALGPSKTIFKFDQPIKIPAYLLALAVGDLQGVPIGPRSTVWAEPSLVQKAADEFTDTEDFLRVAEEIAGPYQWGIYDLLVLPASFPYGGMENPCLTFLSPSLIAGDKSLVDVVAHEIAHSWSGNLVTNADWSAFWLNEGFTMFLERRITGRLRGQPYRHFDACLGLTDLRKDIMEQFGEKHPATALCPDMTDMDPDDAYSRVPYEKGHTFLFYLESIVNKDCKSGDEYGPFGEYLRSYFARFANKSVTVDEWREDFMEWFKANHHDIWVRLNETVDFKTWLYGLGMPPVAVDYDRTLWSEEPKVAALKTAEYEEMKALQKAFFLDLLLVDTKPMSAEHLALMDKSLKLSQSGNVEVELNWFLLAVKHKYTAAYPEIRRFLGQHGRMKALMKSGDAAAIELARSAYKENLHFYHPIAKIMIQKDLSN